jgi:mRNA-degrading endonuclease RelE of RelBE toxin-antitoxin system
MVYQIGYSEGVADDLARLPASQRTKILDRIEVQLKHEPTRPTRNRKILVGLVPPWEHVDPIWELRIGEHRIFYDVDEAESNAVIRAIRHKPPHKATEEIL